jgi:hypothetical protein
MKSEVAATRAGRQARIVAILSARPVHSQSELAALLADDGIEATQATLSRDLEELGAVFGVSEVAQRRRVGEQRRERRRVDTQVDGIILKFGQALLQRFELGARACQHLRLGVDPRPYAWDRNAIFDRCDPDLAQILPHDRAQRLFEIAAHRLPQHPREYNNNNTDHLPPNTPHWPQQQWAADCACGDGSDAN